MTRYSASRGMLYTAPPGPSEDAETAAESAVDADAGEPTPADD